MLPKLFDLHAIRVINKILAFLARYIASSEYREIAQNIGLLILLCPMSESLTGKREDLHDSATHKGRETYCWLESGPLLQPTHWCKVREPWAPVFTHIYRVLDFKHKQWVVSASGLVTCLRSNFIGQTHFKLSRVGLSRGLFWRLTGRLLIG